LINLITDKRTSVNYMATIIVPHWATYELYIYRLKQLFWLPRFNILVRESHNIELAHLNKGGRRRKAIWLFWLGTFTVQCFSAPLGVLLIIKTLTDEWYMHCHIINPYEHTW